MSKKAVRLITTSSLAVTDTELTCSYHSSLIIKQVMRLIITQILPYTLLTMPPSYPSGIQFMEVLKDGRPVILQYGGPDVRNLVAEFGFDVHRMSEICFTLRPHQRSILHVGESWVLGPNYPFVSLSTRDTLTVVPPLGYGSSTRNLSLL